MELHMFNTHPLQNVSQFRPKNPLLHSETFYFFIFILNKNVNSIMFDMSQLMLLSVLFFSNVNQIGRTKCINGFVSTYTTRVVPHMEQDLLTRSEQPRSLRWRSCFSVLFVFYVVFRVLLIVFSFLNKFKTTKMNIKSV